MSSLHRIVITSGKSRGIFGYQLTLDDGTFYLVDDDGENLNQGNATWEIIESNVQSPWE